MDLHCVWNYFKAFCVGLCDASLAKSQTSYDFLLLNAPNILKDLQSFNVSNTGRGLRFAYTCW